VRKIIVEALTSFINCGLTTSIKGDRTLAVDAPTDLSVIITIIDHA
jgi:hypothetical protein